VTLDSQGDDLRADGAIAGLRRAATGVRRLRAQPPGIPRRRRAGIVRQGYTNTTAPIAGLIACQHLHSGADNPQVAFSEQLEGAGFPQTRAEMLDLINSAGEHLCPPDDVDTTGSGDEASP